MSSCRTKLTLLQSHLYNIDLELVLLDDKDITTYGYSDYIKAVGNSNYSRDI